MKKDLRGRNPPLLRMMKRVGTPFEFLDDRRLCRLHRSDYRQQRTVDAVVGGFAVEAWIPLQQVDNVLEYCRRLSSIFVWHRTEQTTHPLDLC
jgi:hypothetical protein